MAESFFSTLECDLPSRRCFCSQGEAHMGCFTSIEGFYHPLRLPSGIGDRSPVDCDKTYQRAEDSALTGLPEHVQ